MSSHVIQRTPSPSAGPAVPRTLGVTAAVCTRDRPQQLRRALVSLTTQRVPPREVLVVDNAPSDNAARDLVRGEFPQVRYFLEPRAGLDFARNRALTEAAGDVVAFLDDDAVAGPYWVGWTLERFTADPHLAVCTGIVQALGAGTPGERLFEENGGFARGERRILLPRDADRRLRGWRAPLIAWSISVGSGCSMAVRRQTILELGAFDEALDLGPELPGGGDLDMLWRCLEAGHHVLYDPAVEARHEHRRDEDAAIDQILGHNRSLTAVLTKAVVRARGRARAEVLAFLAWRLVKPGVRLARRAAGRDPLPAGALLRLWWHCWRGLGTYPRARAIARRRAEALQSVSTNGQQQGRAT